MQVACKEKNQTYWPSFLLTLNQYEKALDAERTMLVLSRNSFQLMKSIENFIDIIIIIIIKQNIQ